MKAAFFMSMMAASIVLAGQPMANPDCPLLGCQARIGLASSCQVACVNGKCVCQGTCKMFTPDDPIFYIGTCEP
ncbi:uncharacterized protein B0J16DRAFT_336215 [Fusarium flagelliforme]|uniref:uncharacterized protein n=1 Tax=Fusarium flagelliforme TaxID=2675880 RepID=UPI001E8EDB1C|nr:uncharacterized protein B0J16DRAFT_336215 [Fusarium flagelliforme]KAH7193893.1 hypothetical protein B0J16DRAFT_336215 [Fusarium flagelliforme]